MDRQADERQYVLEILRQMRREVIANPQWFDPHALERIDEAIALTQDVREEVKVA